MLNGLCNRVEGRSVPLSVINSNRTSEKKKKKEEKKKNRATLFFLRRISIGGSILEGFAGYGVYSRM